MIICKNPEQIVYERMKNIIREDLNCSDQRAGVVAINIIKYLKADEHGKVETYKFA